MEKIEQEKKLPAIEVKNTVVWVNDKIAIPFDLKEGSSTSLGLFLTKNPEKTGSSYNLRVMDNHFRSALLGKVVIQDKEHPELKYRDIDLKGMGPIGYDLEPDELSPGIAKEERVVWGFYDGNTAEEDKQMAEKLTEAGIRTYRILAIIKLDEILDSNGDKISINKARELKYITSTIEPVIEVRAFGTKARIKDAIEEGERWENGFAEDARVLVARELGKNPAEFSVEDYLDWFSNELGYQLAKLHNMGFVHGELHSHNITLDCRFVDLDTIKEPPQELKARIHRYRGDYDFALRSLRQLIKVLKLPDSKNWENKFRTSYKNNISSELLTAINEVMESSKSK